MSDPQQNLRILHLEDNPADVALVEAVLESEQVPFSLKRVATKNDFETELASGDYNLILSDFSLPGFDGMAALNIAKSIAPATPFLFLSGTIGEERAVESLKNGAVDYILKDRFNRLASALRRAHDEALQKSARKQHEDQLRQQAELLNQAQDAIFVMGLDRRITYWNRAAERIYGWSSAEVLGKNAVEILYPDGIPSRKGVWEQLLAEGQWTGELRQQTKPGREITVLSHRSLLRNESGAATSVLAINTDITDRKELEARLLRNQRMESIGALAAGIAHDLNNVLAPIMMTTELLADRITEKDDRRLLDISMTSVRRGADLVKQILQFSRGAKGQEGAANLRVLVDDIARLIQKTFPPSITVQASTSGGALPIEVDATQTHQILLNLCVNARDAMEEGGGVLTISARPRTLSNHVVHGGKGPVSGDFVELAVSDTGTGIPPDIKARIFEPFFTTKPEGKGTGLGLSTVSTILRNHKAFLELETEPGKGTTFRIFFPTARASETTAPADRTGPVVGHGECLLLVDDELALVEMTREVLQANNYDVLTATSGHEALARLEENSERISVVITDLLMPGMNGPELIARVKAKHPNVATLCLSGSVSDESIPESSIPADITLHKPCPAAKLLSALETLLRKSRGA